MTRQERTKNSRPNRRQERKRKAGVGRLVEGAREVRSAGRGDSPMSHTSTSAKRADVYSRITAEIIAAIEQGTGEWRAPWFHNGASIARRPTSLPASAIAVSIRWRSGSRGLRGRVRGWPLGHLQAMAGAGAQVREGERSATVVLWREIQAFSTDQR